MATETVAGVGTAHGNWNGGNEELRNKELGMGERRTANGVLWNGVLGDCRWGQHGVHSVAFALLRVDIEIVWVLRCFFCSFFFGFFCCRFVRSDKAQILLVYIMCVRVCVWRQKYLILWFVFINNIKFGHFASCRPMPFAVCIVSLCLCLGTMYKDTTKNVSVRYKLQQKCHRTGFLLTLCLCISYS